MSSTDSTLPTDTHALNCEEGFQRLFQTICVESHLWVTHEMPKHLEVIFSVRRCFKTCKRYFPYNVFHHFVISGEGGNQWRGYK